jgi:arylsulfatase A-like enzyme/lysophospholipase L1-like esterase
MRATSWTVLFLTLASSLFGALPGPERWEKDIAAFERQDRNQPPPAHGILFIGSSNIRMWSTLADDFAGYPVIQRGFGGCFLSDVAHFADRIAIPYRPRQIIVSAGGNDLHAGAPPTAVLAAYTQFVGTVRAALPDTRIAFMSISPCRARWSETAAMQEVNALVRGYSAGQPHLDFINTFDAMLGPDGQPVDVYFLDDRLHHNATGNAVRAALVRPHLGPRRPLNILHIHADDHRADGLGALGSPALQTPNLDRLVNDGMTFRRCYTQGSMIGAVCLPSRTMLLTGRSLFRIPGPGAPAPLTLAAALRAAGYETWHAGKGGNEYGPGIKAFDTNLVMDDRGPQRAASSRRHADAALDFLATRDAQRPFYMYIAPPVPHDPRAAEAEFHRLYQADSIPLPASFLPQHPWDNGDMTVRDERLAPWPRTPEDTRQQIADYYACISGLDHHMGRIFTALATSGQWSNTLVIFSGDNGLSLGEHGLFGKQNLYEFGGMHVPLVIAGPGIRHGASDALVYLMDLYPTLCDYAGAAGAPDVDGHSLRPVIEGRQPAVRDALYTAYQHSQRAVRNDRWKLIRYPLVNRTQLFDLDADPRELRNLATDPEHAGRVTDMMDLLQREMRAYGDTTPLQVDQPASGDWSPPAQGPADARSRKKLN